MTGSATPAPTLEIPPAPGSSGRGDVGIEALRRPGRNSLLALWEVSCGVPGESMRLLGRMPSRDPKRVAPAVVAEVGRVRRALNLIGIAAPAA